MQNGVDSAGVSSSKIVTTTDDLNDGADLVDSDIVGPFFDPAAESGGPSSNLVGFTLPSSNPVRSASETHLFASTSHRGPLASFSKQCERVKADLQGMGSDGYGHEKGYVSHVEAHYGQMEGVDMWKGCLVGQFLDKRLPFPVVRSLVNKLWGKKEMPDISTTENSLYFFRFRDLDARNWVMESGPWHLAGRPFILRTWRPGMDMLNIQLTSIPIWVKFYNIPLEY